MDLGRYKELLELSKTGLLNHEHSEAVICLFRPDIPNLRRWHNIIEDHKIVISFKNGTIESIFKNNQNLIEINRQIDFISKQLLEERNTISKKENSNFLVQIDHSKFNELNKELREKIKEKEKRVTDLEMNFKDKFKFFTSDVKSFIQDIDSSRFERIVQILSLIKEQKIKISKEEEDKILFLQQCHLSCELNIMKNMDVVRDQLEYLMSK